MSKAYSAQYRQVCPTCKAKSFMPCRTLKTGRVTDTHAGRIANAMKRRVIPRPIPDPPVVMRYFPVQREVLTQRVFDTLAELGYSRNLIVAVLTDKD